MQFEGQIRKMLAEYSSPIHYYLNFKDDFLDVNQQIGKRFRFIHDHNECMGCGLDKEIYRMGYCKNCFFTLPQANASIIRPELSTAHLGIAQRDLEWEQKFELQPHIVYLAVSSGVKVGVTRASQIPTRWIDQGASYACILAETENRYEAGVIEVALAKQIGDKTNYKKMLINEVADLNILDQRRLMHEFVPPEMKKFLKDDPKIYTLEYPVVKYPASAKVVSLAKKPEFEGVLSGIKGQYLLFEDGSAINIRGHEGFYVKLEIV